jgi:hypothetical protein
MNDEVFSNIPVLEANILKDWINPCINEDNNIDFTNLNLLNLANILIDKFNNLTDKKKSLIDRVLELGFANNYSNPLFQILFYSILLNLKKKDGKPTELVKDCMKRSFDRVVEYYFNE